MAERIRLDTLLVSRGLVRSREEARRLILAGKVRVGDIGAGKASMMVDADVLIDLEGSSPYVSRGGEKLAHVIDLFKIPVEGKDCLDVGSSTGGFTHCLLEHGARRVTAVDVGYGILAWELRQDPRVTVLERTNARYLTPDAISYAPSLVVVDVSFISVTKVFPALSVVAPDARFVILLKPQFEAGRDDVPRSGVISDEEVHRRVLRELITFFTSTSYNVRVTWSPLRGTKGNIEYFAVLERGGEQSTSPTEEEIETVIRDAFEKTR